MSAVGDHDRQIGNLVMFGVVAELDATNARVKVDCDGMRTDWIPWTVARAGPGVRAWLCPDVGEQVIVLCPYGDPAQGVVLGSVYQDAFPANASAKEQHRFTFADGTRLQYNRSTHTLTVDITESTGKVVINCNTAEVHATEKVTIDTPTTQMTGDLIVDGKIDAGDNITTPAEVTAGNIGLKTHKHPTAPSGPVSPPVP